MDMESIVVFAFPILVFITHILPALLAARSSRDSNNKREKEAAHSLYSPGKRMRDIRNS